MEDRSRSRSPTKRYRKKSRSRSRSVSLVRVYRKSQSPSFKKYPLREFPRKIELKKQPVVEKRQLLPTPKELNAQASEIGAERYKWEKYR